MGMKKSICFLGFSVTADKGGYVESLSEALPDLEIEKVGIGGVHPHQAKYIFSKYIEQTDHDLYFIEWITSSFRNFLSLHEYACCLISIIDKIRLKGAVPVLLDLPKIEIDYSKDWVLDFHQKLSKKYNVDRVCLCEHIGKYNIPIDSLLKDAVHPNEEGIALYSHLLSKRVLNLIQKERSSLSILDDKFTNVYSSINILDTRVSAKGQFSEYKFERSGYVSEFAVVAEKNEVVIKFNGQAEFKMAGFCYLMGPKSGLVQLTTEDNRIRMVNTYDQHCYYTRLGAFALPSGGMSSMHLMVLPDLPEIELQKGVVDKGAREVAIGDIFLESELISSYQAEVSSLLKSIY